MLGVGGGWICPQRKLLDVIGHLGDSRAYTLSATLKVFILLFVMIKRLLKTSYKGAKGVGVSKHRVLQFRRLLGRLGRAVSRRPSDAWWNYWKPHENGSRGHVPLQTGQRVGRSL